MRTWKEEILKAENERLIERWKVRTRLLVIIKITISDIGIKILIKLKMTGIL